MRKHKSAWGAPHAPTGIRWGTKVLALFLSLAMCLSMLPTMALVPMTAFAEEAPSFGGGTGTQDNYFERGFDCFGSVSKLWQSRNI